VRGLGDAPVRTVAGTVSGEPPLDCADCVGVVRTRRCGAFVPAASFGSGSGRARNAPVVPRAVVAGSLGAEVSSGGASIEVTAAVGADTDGAGGGSDGAGGDAAGGASAAGDGAGSG
jgi:hypothetical protein